MSYSELSAALVRECAAWKERCERAEQEVARLKEELAMDPGYVAAAREEQARADSLAQEVASLRAKLAEAESGARLGHQLFADQLLSADALRADAERYRYLRSLWKVDHFSTEVQPDGDPAECDAAIDSARQNTEHQSAPSGAQPGGK